MIEFTITLPIRGALQISRNRVIGNNIEPVSVEDLSMKLTGTLPYPLRVWKHYDYEAETCTAVIECEDATWAALFQTELAGKSLQQILDIEVAHALELEELDTTEPTGDLVDGREKRRAVSLPDLAGRKLAVEAKLRRGFTKTDAAVAEWKRTRGTR